MQLGKYKERGFNRSFGRQKKFSFKLYYGLTLILSGFILLIIGLITKLL